MNYYPRFPGDYMRKTLHLSMVEDGAYTRLLDWYYANEEAIPHDRRYAISRASSAIEKKAVDAVLSYFFTHTDNVHRNERADEEVMAAAKRIAAARDNGSKGGRKPKTQPSTNPADNPVGSDPANRNANRNESSPTPNSSSLRSEHSDPDGSGGSPPIVVEPRDIVFALGVTLLTAAGVSEKNARSFLALRSKTHTDPVLAGVLQECATAKPVQPIPWIEQRLGTPKKIAGKHAGFSTKDYREGVTEDGLLT